MSSSSAPTHVAESIADRKKSRDLHEARQAGTAAPEVDIKTGAMINPHNPEFITKRPWYLGGADDGPSLSHQSSQHSQASSEGLSLTTADALLQSKRLKSLQNKKNRTIVVGSWVEALRRGKKPYVMCKVTKVHRGGKELDLKYDDGYIEKKVRNDGRRIKMTNVGNRSDIVADDTAAGDEAGKETYDSKRDKYHGFDTSGAFTKKLEQRFATRDALRRQLKKSQEEQQQQQHHSSSSTKNKPSNEPTNTPSDSDSDLDSDIGSDSDDEFVQRDEDAKTFTSRLARQGGVGGAQMKVTARNLRIREDTAKYLRNLDLNSAFYDPKSRSMRDNPIPDAAPEEVPFAGDNFARVSGDAITLAKTQLFAWEAQNKGVSEIHPQANPSQAELLEKKFNKQSDDIKRAKKTAVLAKYGGAEHLDGTDGLGGVATAETQDGVAATTTTGGRERKVRFGVSTEETMYTRDGRVVNSNQPQSTSKKQMDQKSKYDEDVYINAHTTVWGSYFHKGAFRWGYADDHSLMKNSYCTGVNGRKANDDANEMRYGTGVAGSAALKQAREMLKALPSEQRRAVERPTTASLYGEAIQKATFDKEKLEKALDKAKERERKEADATDERKRKYNSMTADDVDVTEEDMEAYRLRKGRGAEDPMAKLGSEGDELLDYKR